MSAINDPIFPSVDHTETSTDGSVAKTEFFGSNGLTKLEYFTAQALSGLLSNKRQPIDSAPEEALRAAKSTIALLDGREPTDEELIIKVLVTGDQSVTKLLDDMITGEGLDPAYYRDMAKKIKSLVATVARSL